MKKIIFAIAAGAMMLVSCNNEGLSPEGQKAWDNFKDLAATFESVEAADANYDSAEDHDAGYAEFKAAVDNIQNYATEISETQADSFQTMCETCAATYAQSKEMIQAADEIEEAADELDEMEEEEE